VRICFNENQYQGNDGKITSRDLLKFWEITDNISKQCKVVAMEDNRKSYVIYGMAPTHNDRE